MSNVTMTKVKVVSFFPVQGVPREDYLDFLNAELDYNTIEPSLALGVFPPGLILQRSNGPAAQVWGEYGKPQRLVRL